MEWLVVSWALTLGWMPQNIDSVSRNNDVIQRDMSGCFVQTVELGATIFDFFSVYTEIETMDTTKTFKSFTPFSSEYIVGTKLSKNGFTVGMEHSCLHPVLSSSVRKYKYEPMFGTAKTTLYFKIEGKHTL